MAAGDTTVGSTPRTGARGNTPQTVARDGPARAPDQPGERTGQGMNWVSTLVKVLGNVSPFTAPLVRFQPELDSDALQAWVKRLEDTLRTLHEDRIAGVGRIMFCPQAFGTRIGAGRTPATPPAVTTTGGHPAGRGTK